jgi:DNA adenine methylase
MSERRFEGEQLGLKLEGAAAPEAGAAAAPEPLLKWAGGKSQLLAQFEPFFPGAIVRYVEPFLGGGAVFFHLRGRFPDMAARLCDDNAELINCYRVARDAPEELMRRLDEHLDRFNADRRQYYYVVRGRHQLEDLVARAARMVFLNRTCFNGLWRVNRRGEFNVPMGRYGTVTLYRRENLLAVSRALQGVELAVQDFRQTLTAVQRGDFVYLDPPYQPVSATASFTAYTSGSFGESEQRELARLFATAAGRGARLMLSNSDTPLVRRLYRGFTIQPIRARRFINSKGDRRGAVKEVLVLAGG